MLYKEPPLDFGKNFWKIDRKLSGRNIDAYRDQNIPFNSKTIDRTVGQAGVVSHKSTDIRLKSYQSQARLYSLGMWFARQLAAYKGEVRMDHQIGATYNLQWAVESPEATRTLEWFIPEHELSLSHENTIRRIIAGAALLNITIKIFPVLDY
jgi:hypothetical protein